LLTSNMVRAVPAFARQTGSIKCLNHYEAALPAQRSG
jgi:hypothetical protein